LALDAEGVMELPWLQIFPMPSVLMICFDFVFQENEPILTILKSPTNYN